MSKLQKGLITLSAMASASVMMTSVALADSQIETAVIDISGVEHFNPQGDAGNTKIQFNVPNGATIAIRAVGWNGTYSTFGTSWVSEAVISFADQGSAPALFITPGVGNDAPGQNVPLSSNGLITLGSVSIPNIPVFSGVVELEFFDTFQDDPNGPEGVWGKGSTITIQYRVVKGGACPADLNNSGAVDVQDLLILLGAWGNNPGHPADLNNSGAVDVQDLLILLGAWGPCPPSTTVTGACCYFDSQTCDDLTEKDCNASSGGSYAGDWTECDTWACPTPPDGTSCAEAVQIALNTPTRLSTVGNAVPTFAQCFNAPAPGAGAAWYRVTGNGTQYTAASCGSGLGSVRVAVFCGTCAALQCIAGEFEDPDANCGNSFQAAATWCAADGINYFIAVYGAGTSEGNVLLEVTSDNSSCTPSDVDCGILGDPVCTLTEPQCQERSGGSYTNSNTNSFKVADDFNAAATGNITSVCWQGVELVFSGGFNVCPDNDGQGLPFRITYYNDASGVPGTVKAGPFTVQPTYSRIAFIGFAFGNAGLIDYTATHPAVSVTAGGCYWIEITQVHAGAQCLFLWAPSDQGNGIGYQRADDGQPYTPANQLATPSGNNDRTFCVNINLGDAEDCVPVESACCVNGVCSLQTAENCAAAGGCFYPAQACGSVTCASEDYFDDCGIPALNVGFGAGGVVAMYQQYTRLPGNTKVTQILSAFGAGDAVGPVTIGQTFGWAIMTDTGTAPGTIIAQGTGTVTATPGSAGLNVVNVDVAVPATFYVVTWIQGTFVTIMDTASAPATPPSRVMIGGTTGATFPGTYNPAAPGLAPTSMTSLNAAWNGHWILRANGE